MPAGGINELSALIDPALIEQALAATGKASIRRRKLPADHAVWLVIVLALFRQMPMWQVVQEMALTLEGQDMPVPSSSVQARQRLGPEPLAHLFGLLTNAWARARPVHDNALRVLAVDGVVWSAPDSLPNRADLGSGKTQYGPQPWPMVRGVCLLDTDSHELLDARLLRSKQPELVMQEVWGVLLAHTLLRRWMRLMAEHVGVAPLRISFHTAKHAIIGALNTVHMARAGTLPKHLRRLLDQARYYVLPPRRPDRSFPREVKRATRSKYPSKKMPVSVN